MEETRRRMTDEVINREGRKEKGRKSKEEDEGETRKGEEERENQGLVSTEVEESC